jgi:hypothetical protein
VTDRIHPMVAPTDNEAFLAHVAEVRGRGWDRPHGEASWFVDRMRVTYQITTRDFGWADRLSGAQYGAFYWVAWARLHNQRGERQRAARALIQAAGYRKFLTKFGHHRAGVPECVS